VRGSCCKLNITIKGQIHRSAPTDVKEKDKNAVLNFLVNKIGQLGNIENIDDLRKEVMDREALGSTT